MENRLPSQSELHDRINRRHPHEEGIFIEDIPDLEQKFGTYFDILNQANTEIFDHDLKILYRVYSYFNVLNGLMRLSNNMTLIEDVVENIVEDEYNQFNSSFNRHNYYIKLKPEAAKILLNDISQLGTLGGSLNNYNLQLLQNNTFLDPSSSITTTEQSGRLIGLLKEFLETKNYLQYIDPLVSHLNSIMYN